MHLTIRFSYGLAVPWVRQIKGGITAVAGPDALVLRNDVEIRGKKEDLSSIANFRVGPGAEKSFVLSRHPAHEDLPQPLDVNRALVGPRIDLSRALERRAFLKQVPGAKGFR